MKNLFLEQNYLFMTPKSMHQIQSIGQSHAWISNEYERILWISSYFNDSSSYNIIRDNFNRHVQTSIFDLRALSHFSIFVAYYTIVHLVFQNLQTGVKTLHTTFHNLQISFFNFVRSLFCSFNFTSTDFWFNPLKLANFQFLCIGNIEIIVLSEILFSLTGRCAQFFIFFEIIYFIETTKRNSFLVHFIVRCIVYDAPKWS